MSIKNKVVLSHRKLVSAFFFSYIALYLPTSRWHSGHLCIMRELDKMCTSFCCCFCRMLFFWQVISSICCQKVPFFFHQITCISQSSINFTQFSVSKQVPKVQGRKTHSPMLKPQSSQKPLPFSSFVSVIISIRQNWQIVLRSSFENGDSGCCAITGGCWPDKKLMVSHQK